MYWKIRYFVLNCELYGLIWSIKIIFKNTVSTVQRKKKEMGYVYIV